LSRSSLPSFSSARVDEAVSEVWALLVSRLRAAGRRVPVNDSWIAATAIPGLPPFVIASVPWATPADWACEMLPWVERCLSVLSRR
jgi:hypothetical protein